MNTHATNLLHALIEGLMNATPTTELHTHQMLAAELKGAMQAQAIEDGQIDTPTPDADGWVENTGIDPECMVVSIMIDGGVFGSKAQPSKQLIWTKEGGITHYKPV